MTSNLEDHIERLAIMAAVLEVSTSPKPGNVHRYRDFSDTNYEHFLGAAIGAGPIWRMTAKRGIMASLDEIEFNQIGVGKRVYQAIQEGSRWHKGRNTNLGIVLLLIPLCAAAGASLSTGNRSIQTLRTNLSSVLRATTVKDAMEVVKAINLIQPGGLGIVPKYSLTDKNVIKQLEQDEINLYSLFLTCSEYDLICSEYINDFMITFNEGVPIFKEGIDSTDFNRATIQTYLKLLSTHPDSHISRIHGSNIANNVSAQAQNVLYKGGVYTDEGWNEILLFDNELHEAGINPGTIADITAATLFIGLFDGARP